MRTRIERRDPCEPRTGQEDGLWGRAFGELGSIAGRPGEPHEKAASCAARLRALGLRVGDPRTRHDIALAAEALDGYSRRDASALAREFDRIIQTPIEAAGRESVFAFVVKEVHGGAPQPLIIHGTLDRRVLEAQRVLRSRAFLDRIAKRLGAAEAPSICMSGRVQGVDIAHLAGHSRYAVFFDFLDGVDPSDAHSRGGLLLSVVADDFLDRDLRLVRRRAPESVAHLEALGVLNDRSARFLYAVFLVLHDGLGHKHPHPLNHPSKRAVSSFLLDPIEEFGADAQFFWACMAEEARRDCLEVMSSAELEALPYLWLMKRLFHYPQRGTAEDPERGRLMRDADARTGILWWGFLCAHGAIRHDGSRVELDASRLPAAFDRALDAWLEVERELVRGVDAYARALERFTAEYGSTARTPSEWILPTPLRMPS